MPDLCIRFGTALKNANLCIKNNIPQGIFDPIVHGTYPFEVRRAAFAQGPATAAHNGKREVGLSPDRQVTP
jgi:hypothetical protein